MAEMKSEDENVVRLEVDASSLQGAFNNIAEGFTNHGKALRSLRFWQGFLGVGMLTANVGVLILTFVR